jgi:thiamine transport system ATP-binding protein
MVTHDPQDALTLGGLTSFVAEGISQTPVETTALMGNPSPALREYLGRN